MFFIDASALLRHSICMKKITFSLLFLSLSGFVFAQNQSEDTKIEKLLTFIESHNELRFIRNGSEYSAKEAADHLRSKRESAGSRIKTARQFIEYIASKSYLSGKLYQIKYPDGKLRPSGDVLTDELKRIETAKP
jgi:Family of unknown function (DUF5329)